jgi:hypothetical protein
MERLWSLIVGLVLGVLSVVTWQVQRRRAERARLERLKPGAVVFVHAGDGKRLVARILSRGVSHFWIELPPGDARWWVPVSAVEPAPEGAVFESASFRRRGTAG